MLCSDSNDVKEVYLTDKELAVRWRMSPRTFRNWRVAKKGPRPTYLRRRSPRYALSEVRRCEQAGQVGAEWPAEFLIEELSR